MSWLCQSWIWMVNSTSLDINSFEHGGNPDACSLTKM